MQLTNYEVVYLITNILYIYTIALFLGVFFNKKRTNKWIEFISYAVYYFIISIIYIIINIPLIMMISNIILLIIISCNYKANISKRLLCVVYIYSILVIVEVLIAVLFQNISFSLNQKNGENITILQIIIIRFVSYFIALLIRDLKNNNKESKIPLSYWIAIIIIPLGTMHTIFAIFQSISFSQYQKLVTVSVLLFINVMVFYLYDQLSIALVKEQEQALLKQQNNYYNQQFNLMQESIKKVRTIKHDLKNHLFVIQSFIQMNNCEKAMLYISKILESSNNYHEYIQSGNVVIDSILNYKLARAEEKNIETHIDVVIPKDLNITPFSMSVILGNLLDNAMNATEKLEDNRRIDIGIKYKSNMLIIKVDNTFDGNVDYKQGEIVTTHVDKENHGLGLQSIRRMLEQHDGELKISHDEEIFSATSLMYI